MHNKLSIKRALISVSDKENLIPLAQYLTSQNIELLSTGGTSKLLKEHKIPVIDVSEYTGFPEIMDGRVKTLNPKIYGGILARRDLTEDLEIMEKLQILEIDLIVVNLYPFEKTINKENYSFDDAIENIDIGGPCMVRAAAKNHKYTSIVVSPKQYDSLILEMKENNNIISANTNFKLAVKAFEHTAHYDSMIAQHLSKYIDKEEVVNELLPYSNIFNINLTKKQNLRYGENPHQTSAFYVDESCEETSVSSSTQKQGKELSFNNIADADAALECVKEFDAPTCVIVKHANPCGVASSNSIKTAYQKAFKTDPTSAFGGIIAFNRELDYETAKLIIENQFVEVIIAPKINSFALSELEKKPNIRVLETGEFKSQSGLKDYKKVAGGLLVQDKDSKKICPTELSIVTTRKPETQELKDALFAWKVAKFVKSNAIVYTKNDMTIGIGAGQMSRVYSAKIAGIKANDEGLIVEGSVMASDAFFPFRDGIDAAAKAGITCIIQPGGSIRDQEIIDAANEHNIAMIFTKIRHFKH